MTLEQAVRRLTFDSASAFGIYDRGLLRPGMAADIVIFDPDTVRPLPETIVHDFPAGGWRIKEPAAGIDMTDRQRPGPARGRQAHRRAPRPRPAQHPLPGAAPRLSRHRPLLPSPACAAGERPPLHPPRKRGLYTPAPTACNGRSHQGVLA